MCRHQIDLKARAPSDPAGIAQATKFRIRCKRVIGIAQIAKIDIERRFTGTQTIALPLCSAAMYGKDFVGRLERGIISKQFFEMGYPVDALANFAVRDLLDLAAKRSADGFEYVRYTAQGARCRRDIYCE